MLINEQIQTEIVAAMKAKDSVRLTTLRAIKLKFDACLKEGKSLDVAAEQKILEGLVKQRIDSITMFEKGARADLVAIEQAELAIIKSYMPTDATMEELEHAITAAMRLTMDLGPKAIGTIMSHVKTALAEKRVDGRILSEKIKARFTTPA